MAESTEHLAARLRTLAARLEREGLPTRRRAEAERALAGLEAVLGEESARRAGTVAAPVEGSGPIRIWCDGSCAPNPGPGGWGAIVERDGRRLELSGASPDSTNNIMEMTAAIEALGRTPPGSAVHITTDSRYLMDGITRWIAGWKRRNWRKADGQPVLNRSYWQRLDALLAERKAKWSWVPGHAGHPENERCDQLANEARRAQ